MIWGAPAWGRWFDLGRLPEGYAREGIPHDWFERAIETGNDHVTFYLRHFVMLIPGCLAIAWIRGEAAFALAPFIMAAVIVLAYESAWRVRPANPIIIAEVLTGLIWGIFINLASR
jgi:hypothetical protein